MTIPMGTPIAIPPELEAVRATARRAISPIKPADSNTKAEQQFLFTATPTKAGEKLPPFYLVYFLLVDLLGFHDLGRFEKLAWSVPIDFEGDAYLIEYRKFGVGVFARKGDEWERQAVRIVTLMNKGVVAAKPFFQWMAENAVQASKVNVHNVGIKLFRRYIFFRDRFSLATAEVRELRQVHEAEERQREFSFPLHSTRLPEDASWLESYELFRFPWASKSEQANWFALAAVEAFFAWTEHIFIHLAILQGRVTTGIEVAKLAEADWTVKFKKAFDITDRATKKHFDTLLTIRRQLRNFIAHGAFGKQGEAFSFHSKTGAVPVALDHKPLRPQWPQFSLTPESAFDDAEAVAAVEAFISFMWSGGREPAKIYIQETELPLILPYASDGAYSSAMASKKDMQRYVDQMTERFDNAVNMDW
jgi:hypothetical protein